jgi:hypothetical protein
MGKTGVCPEQLNPIAVQQVLDWCIKVLILREFIDVLLPWVSRIVLSKHVIGLN